MSSNFGANDVLIFDQAGYGPNNQQTCVVNMLKKLIRNKKVKLDEVAIIISACGQLGQWQRITSLKFLATENLLNEHPVLMRKKIVVQTAGIQGQDIQKLVVRLIELSARVSNSMLIL